MRRHVHFARPDNDLEKAMQVFLRMMAGDDPAAMMCEAEVAKGYTLIPVGSVPWLPACDWGERDVVSTDGHEVRLVAIGAKRKRNGAFTDLVSAILAEGKLPVVICPLDDMRSILRRWGWTSRLIGVEFDEREDQWRPRPGWEPRTEAFASAGTGTPTTGSTAAGGPTSRQGG